MNSDMIPSPKIHPSVSIRTAFLAVWMACPTLAHAQIAPDGLPGSSDPSRISLPALPRLSPAEIAPAPQREQPSLPPEAEQTRLQLHSVTLEGNLTIPEGQLRPLWQKQLGREVSVADLYRIAEAVTLHYHDKGYILSRAYLPPQDITEGKLVIRVFEGAVDSVTLEGDYTPSSLLDEAADRLRRLRPLQAAPLERQLLLLNDLAGVRFRAVLESLEQSLPGQPRIALRLVAEKEAPSAGLSVDNFSSRFLGPVTATGRLQLAEPWLRYGKSDISLLQSMPFQELSYLQWRQTQPLTSDGWSAFGGASYAFAQPGYTLEALDIESQSWLLEAGLAYALIRQRSENVNLSASLDARNTNTDSLNSPLVRDRIRAGRFRLDALWQDEAAGSNALNLTVSQGLPGLGAASPGSLTLSRADAQDDFQKLELSFQRLQPLGQAWSLLASASGQLASKGLPSAEEFGFGGPGGGRAYDPSELTGDSGVSTLWEVRYDWALDEGAGFLQPFVFYDLGSFWNRANVLEDQQTGSSAGIGLRYYAVQGLQASLSLAQPLTREVNDPLYGSGDAARLLLELGYQY